MATFAPTAPPGDPYATPASPPAQDSSFKPGGGTVLPGNSAATLQGLGVPTPPPVANPTSNPALAADPAYQAFMRNLGLEESTAKSNTASQSEAIDRQLAARRALLGDQNTQAIGGINNSMEARGLYTSGENESHQVRQRVAYGQQDASAIADAADRKAALQQALSDRIAGLERGAATQALSSSQALALQDAASRIQAGGSQAPLQVSGVPGGRAAPAQVGQWINQAIAATGVPASWAPYLAEIAQHESGFNPASINNHDPVGNGTFQTVAGLMNMLGSTFNAHALPGHGNILNPVDNLISAIRYIQGRYGQVTNVPGVKAIAAGKSYVGY